MVLSPNVYTAVQLRQLPPSITLLLKVVNYMSYDLSICTKYGDELKHSPEFNYTYNVHKMYKLAFKSNEGIKTLAGYNMKTAYTTLVSAISYMQHNKPELELLNPSNGWGSYGGALNFLESICQEVLNHIEKDYIIYIT